MLRYKKPMTAVHLAALEDKDINFSDQPETNENIWTKAKVVTPAGRNQTQSAARFDRNDVD